MTTTGTAVQEQMQQVRRGMNYWLKLTVALPPSPAVDAVEESADDDHHQDRHHDGHPLGAGMPWPEQQQEHNQQLNRPNSSLNWTTLTYLQQGRTPGCT